MDMPVDAERKRELESSTTTDADTGTQLTGTMERRQNESSSEMDACRSL